MKSSRGFVWLPVLLVMLGLAIIGGGVSAYMLGKSSQPQEPIYQEATTTGQLEAQASGQLSPYHILIDQSSLVVTSSDAIVTGTAQGPTSISLEVHARGKSGPSYGHIDNIPVIDGKWSMSLFSGKSKWGTGFINQLSPGGYIICASAPDNISDCEELSVQTPISVSGMSQYTDTDFGFSFWYPSSWKVWKHPSGSGSFSPMSVDLLAPRPDGGNVIEISMLELDQKPQTSSGEFLVTLGSNKFLLVSQGSTESTVDPKYIFATILPTDPSASTSVNAEEQRQAVQTEKNAYILNNF